MGIKRLKERQQVPGNGKLFSSRFCSSNEDIHRSIGVLEWIADGREYTEKEFIGNVKDELYKCYGHEKNKSCEVHFANNLIFYGFLEKRGKDRLRISLSGRDLLDEITSQNCDERRCVEIVLNAMQNVKYPNLATKRVAENVKSKPFCILFRTLLREKFITGKFLRFQLPYVINAKSLDFNPDLKISMLKCGPHYHKWDQWVVSMLVNIGVLESEKSNYTDEDFVRLTDNPVYSDSDRKIMKAAYSKIITISTEFRDLVEYYYGDLSVKDLFHNEDVYNAGVRCGKKYNRDSSHVEMVKNRDNFTCRLTGHQSLWKSKGNNKPYCTAHHILPVEFREEILEEYRVDVDSPEYMITISGDIHDCIHKGTDLDRIELLRQAYNCLLDESKSKIDLTEEKYFELYGVRDF